jgi:HlyD family secretion protein
MRVKWKNWLLIGVLVAAAAAGGAIWWRMRPPAMPPGILQTNGRIEATQIDIATKLPGRVKEVLVNEGDFIEPDQLVARMDTLTLEAELRQAQAQVREARNAKETALAVVAQRKSELTYAQNSLKRSEELLQRGFVSQQKLDADRTAELTAEAALMAAKSRVVEAQSAIEATLATVERVKTEIDDSALRAPRAGRVQYRLAEPGEVLPAGGKVVSMLDVSDVYMTVFVPEAPAGRLAIGAQARLVLDAAPQYVVPARVTFVAADAQFTPKTVETASERQKLVFRVKLQIDPELLRKYRTRVKAGVPGMAYVQADPGTPWPANLEVRLPQP